MIIHRSFHYLSLVPPEEFEVQSILTHKGAGDSLRFQVKWVGYNHRFNRYLARRDLEEGCQELLEEYMQRHPECFPNTNTSATKPVEAPKTTVSTPVHKETPTWVGLDRGQLEEVIQLLKRNTTADTQRRHEQKLEFWREFLHVNQLEDTVGVLLQGCLTDTHKTEVFSLFVNFLVKTKQLRGEQAQKPIRALFDHLVKNVQCIQWTKSENVRLVRKATRSSNAEYVNKHRGHFSLFTGSQNFAPLTLDMMEPLRNITWDDKWDAPGLDRKREGLAIRLTTDSGLRIGHFGPDNLSQEINTHQVLRRDAWCLQKDGNKWSLTDVTDLYGKQDPNLFENIVGFAYVVLTSKTGQNARLIEIHRDSELESQLVDDLVHFIARSGGQPDDPLLHRYYKGKGKFLRRAEINTTIKALATHLNLPQDKFSTRSTRKGFASTALTVNMSNTERNERGGWAQGSTVPERHYVKGVSSQGLFAKSEQPNALSIEHLRRHL
jgi:hypothetical protein